MLKKAGGGMEGQWRGGAHVCSVDILGKGSVDTLGKDVCLEVCDSEMTGDIERDSLFWIGKRRKQNPSSRKGRMKIGGGRVTVGGCHSGRLRPWTLVLLAPVLALLGAGCSSRASAIVCVVELYSVQCRRILLPRAWSTTTWTFQSSPTVTSYRR